MTCRDVAEHLIDFVGGELPAEVLAHLRQHLDRCPPCVTYLETYQLTIRLTRQLPNVPMPEQLVARLKESIAEFKDC